MRDHRWKFAFLTGLLLAFAARTVLAQNEAKKEGGREPAKAELGKAEGAKPTAGKEKTYVFEMRNKQWGTIFEWLTDNTGLPFIGVNTPPTGAFNYMAPRGPKGEQRPLTMPEIIDM